MMSSQIKKIDDELNKDSILGFIQSLDNYVKVSVGNDVYNLAKYDKTQSTNTTIIKHPKNGGYLLQNWVIKCNDRKGAGNIQNFKSQRKRILQLLIQEQQAYLQWLIVLCILRHALTIMKRMFSVVLNGLILLKKVCFYCNRFSARSSGAMGRIRVQLLLDDNTWSTRYNIPENDRHSNSKTDWTLVSLNFTVENYGIKLFYYDIDSALADMCFIIITITCSV